jgi:hypothetical protein
MMGGANSAWAATNPFIFQGMDNWGMAAGLARSSSCPPVLKGVPRKSPSVSCKSKGAQK